MRSVAVVTSLTAAALADVRATLARRLPHVQVWLMPASVQGVGAAPELVKALLKIEQTFAVDTGHIANSTGFLPPEVVLLVRGGGSMEDLWAFNDEALARAIAACSIPVISGVGHETDFSLADFAADLRAPTPTAAAELLCEPTSAWHALADQQQGRLQAALERSLDRFAQRLDFLGNRLNRPAAQVQRALLRQSALQYRIRTAVLRKLEHTNTVLSAHSSVFTEKFAARMAAEHRRLERAAARLEAINPHLVLQRGYAFMTDTSGTPLTRAAQFTNAQDVRAVLADGTVDLRVRSKPGLEFLQSSLI